MAREVLPSAVVEVLAFHGPVEVVGGPESRPVRRTCAVAPYEDVLYLLLPPRSPLEEALLDTHTLQVNARDPKGGSYRVGLVGRGRAPTALGRHRMRSALSAWLPEGEAGKGWQVVPFVAEVVDFRRTEGTEEKRYQGASRADNPPTWRRWLQAGLGGQATPLALFTLLACFLMLGWMGAETPWRPVAFVVSSLAGVVLLGSVRALVLAHAFHRWRAGRARAEDAGMLVEGLLAPRPLARVARLGLLVSLVLFALTASTWGPDLALVAFVCCGAWIAGPAWLLHLRMRSPETRD